MWWLWLISGWLLGLVTVALVLVLYMADFNIWRR